MNPEQPKDAPAAAMADTRDGDSRGHDGERQPATVLVRGETLSAAGSAQPKPQDADQDRKSGRPGSDATEGTRSAAKVQMQQRLPALPDDGEVGVKKPQVVVRDGEPDLAFTGTLLASAAPDMAPKGQWQELRVYETDSGTHVFSRTTRTVSAGDEDQHEAEIFDPTPSSTAEKLLRRAHDLTHSRPMDWKVAAAKFFGYEPLPKALYRKLGGQFEEHIS